MFIAYQNIIRGNLSEVSNDKLFVLNRWASFNPDNALACCKIDKLLLKLQKSNPDLIKFLMHSYYSRRIPKFLKGDKDDKFLVEAIKKYYGLSSKEYELQKHLVSVDYSELARAQGWDKKTCKKYGVEWVEPKKEKLKVEKKRVVGLSDFG
jgi:thiol-disulfide isomerase/thioredoxin